MTNQSVTPMVSAPAPIVASSPINVRQWVCLILLALSIGSNAYLWHLWREDRTVAEVAAQSSQELQMVQTQTHYLQQLKTAVDQWNGDLESLRKADENSQIEIEALKTEIKRLQDSRAAYEVFVQNQLRTYQAQWVKQIQAQKRYEVNW